MDSGSQALLCVTLAALRHKETGEFYYVYEKITYSLYQPRGHNPAGLSTVQWEASNEYLGNQENLITTREAGEFLENVRRMFIVNYRNWSNAKAFFIIPMSVKIHPM